MQLAAANRAQTLELMRSVVRRIARGRENRTATADDAQSWLIGMGWSPKALGNAAGSLFRGGDWEAIGWQLSARASNHGRAFRIWRLKDGR